MKVLTAIKIVNALLGMGIQAMQVRRMMQVIQDAQEEGRDLTENEMDAAFERMDQAELELADAIRRKEEGDAK